MQVLEIGKEFELFHGRNMYGQSGCIMEMLEDGKFCLVVYMDDMSFQEVLILKQVKIQVRVINEADNFILTLIKYGNTELIFEIQFDPTLYSDERKVQFGKSNMLYIIGVDSNTNIIKTLRYVSMPLILYDLFKSAWSLALLRQDFSEKYARWVDDLDKRYSVVQLWDIGKSYGTMGQQELIAP